jgi:hypothetical protein
MKRLLPIIICCLVISGCAIMEQSIDETTERLLPQKPELVSNPDSVTVFKAKSAIQRSPEHILASYVVVKDRTYHLDITKKEMELLGISEKDYQKFLNKLSRINNKH